MAFPPLLTALAIVREKETGTIEQIYASPVTSTEFVVGKLVPYGLVAFLEILMVMVVGFAWFQVPIAGSPILLLTSAFVYVLTTVGIGLLVSSLVRTQLAAMLITLIVTLMPSFLFLCVASFVAYCDLFACCFYDVLLLYQVSLCFHCFYFVFD